MLDIIAVLLTSDICGSLSLRSCVAVIYTPVHFSILIYLEHHLRCKMVRIAVQRRIVVLNTVSVLYCTLNYALHL